VSERVSEKRSEEPVPACRHKEAVSSLTPAAP
jgi:hypothetical protein